MVGRQGMLERMDRHDANYMQRYRDMEDYGLFREHQELKLVHLAISFIIAGRKESGRGFPRDFQSQTW